MEELLMWFATQGLDQYLWSIVSKNASTLVVGAGVVAGGLKLVSRYTRNTLDDDVAAAAGKMADFLKRKVAGKK